MKLAFNHNRGKFSGSKLKQAKCIIMIKRLIRRLSLSGLPCYTGCFYSQKEKFICITECPTGGTTKSPHKSVRYLGWVSIILNLERGKEHYQRNITLSRTRVLK